MHEVRGHLREMLGDGPAADFLAAQIALETADGKYSYGYNVGNMKASNKPGVKYQTLKTWEVENGKRVDMREPFLAHDSLEEGLQTYVEYLDRKGLLEAADSGNLDEFNAALKKAGYYTADQGQYGRNMRKRLDAWAKEDPDHNG
jgi:flagellum-specific peptidoglycan hydrolase FlgJ